MPGEKSHISALRQEHSENGLTNSVELRTSLTTSDQLTLIAGELTLIAGGRLCFNLFWLFQ